MSKLTEKYNQKLLAAMYDQQAASEMILFKVFSGKKQTEAAHLANKARYNELVIRGYLKGELYE